MRIPLLASALLAFSGTFAAAQNVDVKKIEYQVQPTPQFDASAVKGKRVSSPRSWLEIEVEFETKQTNQEGIYPNLKFRYHVAIKGKDGVHYLTGDVDHINVVADQELFSVMYVSPTTLGTITGDYKDFQDGNVQAVAVEVYQDGVLAGGDSEGERGKWWESASLKKGGAKLLNKMDTPFALLWLDRYADVKTSSR